MPNPKIGIPDVSGISYEGTGPGSESGTIMAIAPTPPTPPVAQITGLELIAFERSMFGRGKYVNGTSGKPIAHSGRLEFDCVGFQKWCLRQKGIYTTLFNQTVDPTTVYEFCKMFKGAKDKNRPAYGDLAVFGHPGNKDYRKVYAHIGCVTNAPYTPTRPKVPGHYVSMYDVKLEIVERKFEAYPTMQLITYLHLGLK